MSRSKGSYRFLDVGGTFVKCDDGQVVPIRSQGTAEEISDALRTALGDLSGISGIGVAIPGPFDYKEGVFRMEHKFEAVKDRPFRTLAGVPDAVPVRYMHDVNAALAGAIRMMHIRGDTALVTLGTGLGFGCTRQGRILVNEKGSPARSLYNLPCRDGILEDYVSARGIRNLYAGLGGEPGLTPLQIAVRAGYGDQTALDAFSSAGKILAEYLSPLLEEYRIDTLLFGGQISRSFALMEEPVRKALGRLPWLRRIDRLPEGAVFQGLATLFEND